MTSLRRAGLAAAALLVAGSLAGCGSSSPDPDLAAGLSQVDDAVSSGDLQAARSAVQSLVATANQERHDGDISADDASRIVDAANALLAQLPSAETTPSSSPTPTVTEPVSKPKPAKPKPKVVKPPKPPKPVHDHGLHKGRDKHHDEDD